MKNCEGCPFYLFRDVLEQAHCLRHRANYCAHPAFIESYGIEQYMGATHIGNSMRTDTCVMEIESDPAKIIRDVVRCGHIWDVELRGPKLSSMSLLNPNRKQ